MSRAALLPPEARAFLDALAVGESGGGDEDEDYAILYGGSHFVMCLEDAGQPWTLRILDKGVAWPYTQPLNTWPASFPMWPGLWVNGLPTHAAGRYQFEPRTWVDLQFRLKLPDFSPISQDLAAWRYACERIAGRGGNLLASLKAADDGSFHRPQRGVGQPDLQGVANGLITSWTSLRPSTFPGRYREALKRYAQSS